MILDMIASAVKAVVLPPLLVSATLFPRQTGNALVRWIEMLETLPSVTPERLAELRELKAGIREELR
jgi:hypothetical protein